MLSIRFKEWCNSRKKMSQFFSSYRFGVFCLLIATQYSCSSPYQIIDRPIIFNEHRVEMTKKYIEDHYGLKVDDIKITPKIIVIHYTYIPTLEGSFQAFYNEELPSSRADLKKESQLNVSIQFLVSRAGEIYRLMPENHMARHVIGLNYSSIGIENVGGTENTPLTRAQIRANKFLVKYLSKKHPISYVIGHSQYQNFENHPLWLEKNENYRTVKIDPGAKFLKAVHRKARKLNLKTAEHE